MPGGPTRTTCASPELPASMRAAVVASSPTLRSSPPRASANASTSAIVEDPSFHWGCSESATADSEHLRFGLEESHELGNGRRAFADDPASLSLRRQLHLRDSETLRS